MEVPNVNFTLFLGLTFILFNLFLEVKSQSFLNVEELSALQYGMEIAKEPVLFKGQTEENVMHISSKFGQLYSCKLPEILPSQNEKEKIEKVDPKSVKSILDTRYNATCEVFHKGWWTYEVCHKKNVTQYHIGANGEIEGETTVLGVYEKEDDWANKNFSDHKTRELFHSVNYVNGSLCDLTSKSRKTAVQYYCGELNDMIIRVEEPATCEYIITVHSKALCKHPAFKIEVKLEKFDLVCSPALKEKAFNRYQERKQEELKKQQEEEERRQEILKREEEKRLKKEADENLKRGTVEESKGKKEKIWKDATQGLKMFMDEFLGALEPKEVKLNNLEDELLKIEEKDINIDDDDDDDNKDGTTLFGNNKNMDPSATEGSNKEKLKFVSQEGNDGDDSKFDVENLQDAVAEEIAALSEKDDSLLKVAEEQKQALEKEFQEIKDTTEKEVEKSRNHANTLRFLLRGSKDEEHRKELQDMIDKLDTNTEMFEKQLATMNVRMEKIKQLESKAAWKVQEIDSQFSKAKMIEAVTKKLENIRVKNKDQVIADTVAKIYGKARHKRLNENRLKKDDKKRPSLLDELKKEIGKLNREIQKDATKQSGTDDSVEGKLEVEGTKLKKDALKVRVRSMDDKDLEKELEQDMENLSESVREDVKAATKQMEEAVRKQLKEAGIDLQDNIKIKVITTPEKFDKFKGNELLTSDDAADFKDLFLNFVGGGMEKRTEEKRQKSLQESYEQVWDENVEENP